MQEKKVVLYMIIESVFLYSQKRLILTCYYWPSVNAAFDTWLVSWIRNEHTTQCLKGWFMCHMPDMYPNLWKPQERAVTPLTWDLCHPGCTSFATTLAPAQQRVYCCVSAAVVRDGDVVRVGGQCGCRWPLWSREMPGHWSSRQRPCKPSHF